MIQLSVLRLSRNDGIPLLAFVKNYHKDSCGDRCIGLSDKRRLLAPYRGDLKNQRHHFEHIFIPESSGCHLLAIKKVDAEMRFNPPNRLNEKEQGVL